MDDCTVGIRKVVRPVQSTLTITQPTNQRQSDLLFAMTQNILKAYNNMDMNTAKRIVSAITGLQV